MTIINLEMAIEQLKKGVFDQELKGLESTLPVTMGTIEDTISYAVALANHASAQNYTSLEMLNLLKNLHEIGMVQVARDSCLSTEAMYITDIGHGYQNALNKLMRAGLKKADEYVLPKFVELYAKMTGLAKELKEKEKSDFSAEKKRMFLESQRIQFMENYMLDATKGQRNFYFRRFKGILDYILANKDDSNIQYLSSTQVYQTKNTNLLSESIRNVTSEIRSNNSDNNSNDLYESIYQAALATKNTPGLKVIETIADSVNGCREYIEKRSRPSGKFAALLNARW